MKKSKPIYSIFLLLSGLLFFSGCNSSLSPDIENEDLSSFVENSQNHNCHIPPVPTDCCQ